MSPLLVAQLIVQVGLPAVQQIIGWIEAKREVTGADIQLLVALSKKTGADYLAEAGGAPPPPVAPAAG